jgi:large subunit ribosomal protein L9
MRRPTLSGWQKSFSFLAQTQVLSKDIMAKRIQLVLTKDVSKLGKNGDLVEVAPGYAKNYLLPQGMAVHTTPGILKQVERRREEERQRLLALKAEAETQKKALEALGTLQIAKQVGEGDAIFGTVTDREVAEIITAKANLEIDRRVITVPSVHELGTYTVQIKLHPEVSVDLRIEVVAE